MSFSSARPSSERSSARMTPSAVSLSSNARFSVGLFFTFSFSVHSSRTESQLRSSSEMRMRPTSGLCCSPIKRNEHALERDRRLELREVEHPVQPPVALLDVDGLFEQDHQLGQRRRLHRKRVEVFEVAENFRQVAPLPPVEELVGVDRHHHVVVRPQLGFFLGRPRHDGAHQVAVDGLRDPVLAERHAEAAIHVAARQPPAADVEPHRRNRLRTVQVVEPEVELLLVLVFHSMGVVASPKNWSMILSRSAMMLSRVDDETRDADYVYSFRRPPYRKC